MTDRLYYGDNLDVLRDHIPDESVDLIYLDPPLNSDAGYAAIMAPANASPRCNSSRSLNCSKG